MTFDLKKSIAILEKTPAVLKAMLENLPEDWTHFNEGEETWSAYDVVGHFIHGEKTDWIPRARIILSNRKDKTFESFDRFAQFEDSKCKTLHKLLEEFSKLRAENLRILKSLNLSDEDLILEGTHPELGKVNLKQLLATWTVHDLNHIHQISRVMAKQLKDEIGPWTAYISVVNR